MRRFLNGQDLVNSLMMESSASSSLYLVVEGEDDFDMLIDHVNVDQLELLVGYGKLSLLEAATLADTLGFDRAQYFVDADFDLITGRSASYGARVVATSHYDLVMDIHFRNPSIAERMARKITRTSDMIAAFPSGPIEVIDTALRAAVMIGAIRLANESLGWGLKTDSFPMEDAVRQILGTSSAILDLVAARSPGGIPDRSVLEDRISDQLNSVDQTKLVNGHDFLRAIAAACRHLVGPTRGSNLEDQFAIAVDCSSLHGHRWWIEIDTWSLAGGAAAFHAAA